MKIAVSLCLLVALCACAGPQRAVWENPDLQSTDDSVPTLISAEAPRYPRSPSTGGLREGSVDMLLDISATGEVTDVTVVDSTHQMFEKPAVTAAFKMRWRPAYRDGEPVAMEDVRYTTRFEAEK